MLTISGSIAIERSLLGLKTIYTGYPWWKGMPGTIHINEIKSLNKLPDKYFNKSNTIKKDAKKFICSKLNYNTIHYSLLKLFGVVLSHLHGLQLEFLLVF